MEEPRSISSIEPGRRSTTYIVLSVVLCLAIFLFSIDLMIASLQHANGFLSSIVEGTSNPFAGLFAGLLITALIQSSSTTTSLAVALVASGSITLEQAVPIVMGANVGTTITSSLVSLGFINHKKEFKRAVAAGTYHCFFNLLTVVILFPLEYYYGFLSGASSWLGEQLFHSSGTVGEKSIMHWSPFQWMIAPITNALPGVLVAAIAFVLILVSILFFRKIISDLLDARSPDAFSRFFFQGEFRSFLWGLGTTAAIRSSTITTSVVVPIVAKKIVSIRLAAPFVMGANMGTTITAFIAALMNSGNNTINLALAHFLFNALGVLFFFPVPALKYVPINLSLGLAELTQRYRIAGFLFILLTFFLIPFTLIYLHRA